MSKKTQTFLALLLIGLIVVACSRGQSRTRRFEVVEEGSADGVTSAIAGPGEQLPPMTDTSVDTTTAFSTLPTPPNVDPTLTSPDGSLAGTLPDILSGTGGYPGTYDRRPTAPRRGTIEIKPPAPTATSTEEVTPSVTATTTSSIDPAQQTPPPESKKEPPKEEDEDEGDEEEDEPPPPPPASPLR